MATRTVSLTEVTTLVNYRLKEMRVAPQGPRFLPADVLAAIRSAVRWAEPIGEVKLVRATPPLYFAHADHAALVPLDIMRVTVTGANGGAAVLLPGAWTFTPNDTNWLQLAQPVTVAGPTLSVTATFRIADAATALALDLDMLVNAAIVELFARETQWGAKSTNQTELLKVQECRQLAEGRRQELLLQLWPMRGAPRGG